MKADTGGEESLIGVHTGPTKDRKGLMPPNRTEKNILAPKRTFICHLMVYKCMLII